MAKSSKEWPKPKYDVGQKEHLHAIGVLAFNYNAFESVLFDVFKHHLSTDGMARRTTIRMYSELPERKRLDLIKLVFATTEKDAAVKSAVTKLIKYFEWSADTRNRLVHSQYAPPLFGGKPNKFYISKKASQKSARLHYMRPSTKMLRNAADRIRDGHDYAVSLMDYLTMRDVPRNELDLTVRALMGLTTPELPDIPHPPRRLTKSPLPHTPPLPPHLLQRQRGLKG